MGTIAATSGLLLVGGCKSNKDHYSYHAITSDLTPELQGLTERQIDIDTNIAVNENMNKTPVTIIRGLMVMFSAGGPPST